MRDCTNGSGDKQVNRFAAQDAAFAALERDIVACRKCHRLITHIETVAQVKRRAYRDWEYWGQPVPSFGPGDARLLILGLAPGAHGANRTGRVFTGDSSGKLLYRVLHATGFASQAESVSRRDGLRLLDARITCAVHCAPPDNKPLPSEVRTCRTWLESELALMSRLAIVVALGKLAFDGYLAVLRSARKIEAVREFRFGHNCEYQTGAGQPTLIGSYHPSQQNTSTGKLNEAMLLAVFERARAILSRSATGASERSGLPESALPLS